MSTETKKTKIKRNVRDYQKQCGKFFEIMEKKIDIMAYCARFIFLFLDFCFVFSF